MNSLVFDTIVGHDKEGESIDSYLNLFIFMYCARVLIDNWKSKSIDSKVMSSLNYWNIQKLTNFFKFEILFLFFFYTFSSERA